MAQTRRATIRTVITANCQRTMASSLIGREREHNPTSWFRTSFTDGDAGVAKTSYSLAVRFPTVRSKVRVSRSGGSGCHWRRGTLEHRVLQYCRICVEKTRAQSTRSSVVRPHIGFAWALRAMIYAPDMSIRETVCMLHGSTQETEYSDRAESVA